MGPTILTFAAHKHLAEHRRKPTTENVGLFGEGLVCGARPTGSRRAKISPPSAPHIAVTRSRYWSAEASLSQQPTTHSWPRNALKPKASQCIKSAVTRLERFNEVQIIHRH